MEVILLKDVKGLGKKGETKTVADGYAQNFLIPRKLVVKKTEESLATLKKENEIEAKKQERVISFDSSTWFENFYQLKSGKVILGQADSFILLNENGFNSLKKLTTIAKIAPS